MQSSPQFKGVKIHWGVSSTTTSAFGTLTLQSRDHSRNADTDIVQDATGFAVNKTFFNYSDTATFEYIPTAAAPGAGNVTPTVPEAGDMVTVVDSVYTQIAGTNWIVDSASTRSSNTSAMRVTVNLTRYPLITS